MAQVFNELRKDNVRDAIYEDAEQKFDTLRSNFSGDAFPENPFVGQFCFRTDESKMYHWNGEEWKEVGSGGAGKHVGEVFFTSRLGEIAGAVDADGSTYSVSQFTGEKSIPALLAAGELPYVSMSEYENIVSANGSCRAWGWDNGDTFRVPKLNDVYLMAGQAESAGEFISESLPNITGTTGFVLGNSDENTGAFSSTQEGGYAGGTLKAWKTDFNASRSSSAYQDGAKVRPDSVRYRALVQVASSVKEDATQLKNYKFNVPNFFGQSIWSEVAPNNASWLLSNGAYHSGVTYTDMYKQLQVELNSSLNVGDTIEIDGKTFVKRGLPVKTTDDTYDDYDFVINTADNTFRLPLDTKLASGKAVKGNGMALGFNNGGLALNGSDGSVKDLIVASGLNVGEWAQSVATNTAPQDYYAEGVATDPEKSGIETASDGLKLYFYVGDTLQDAQLINAGRALNDIAELKGHAIVEEYHNGTDGYRIWSNGFIEQWGKTVPPTSEREITLNFLIPFKDTDYIYVDSIQSTSFYSHVFNMYWVENTGRTTTSIKLWSSQDVSRNWFACGYIR